MPFVPGLGVAAPAASPAAVAGGDLRPAWIRRRAQACQHQGNPTKAQKLRCQSVLSNRGVVTGLVVAYRE